MYRDNPLWGAPRIHGELLLLGFSVAQATVSNYMPRRGRGSPQGWRSCAHIGGGDRNRDLRRGSDRTRVRHRVGHFSHVIAGSVEATFIVTVGHAMSGDYAFRSFLPAQNLIVWTRPQGHDRLAR